VQAGEKCPRVATQPAGIELDGSFQIAFRVFELGQPRNSEGFCACCADDSSREPGVSIVWLFAASSLSRGEQVRDVRFNALS
jgi:hypothetical protein